jgi:hypothetical protein
VQEQHGSHNPPTRGAFTTDAIHATPATSEVGAASSATEQVNNLIEGRYLSIPNVEMWAAVVAGGRIIQTTTLAEIANRATVAVSVAFETPIEGALTEPIALRLEMLITTGGWTITAIGYL